MGKHYAESTYQVISLADGCNNVPTIVHEMMHAVGNFSFAFLCDGQRDHGLPLSHVLARRSRFACRTTMSCHVHYMVSRGVASFSTS